MANKIASRVISIPDSVTVTKISSPNNDGFELKISGPKGQLHRYYHQNVDVIVSNKKITTKPIRKEHDIIVTGTINSLINSDIIGVTSGFAKTLLINGVGFRAKLTGDILELNLGYSHPCKLTVPAGINVEVVKTVKIIVSGICKQLVGQYAAKIKALYPVECYHLHGIRYENEFVIRKVGKAAGK